MSLLLLVFFILLPIVEITLLIDIGGNIGAGATILLILTTAMVGMVLVRYQGFSLLRDAQSQISKGQPPAKALAHGILVLLAGLMLIIPGFFTDGVGFLLLLPPVRSLLLDFVVGSIMTNLRRICSAHVFIPARRLRTEGRAQVQQTMMMSLTPTTS